MRRVLSVTASSLLAATGLSVGSMASVAVEPAAPTHGAAVNSSSSGHLFKNLARSHDGSGQDMCASAKGFGVDVRLRTCRTYPERLWDFRLVRRDSNGNPYFQVVNQWSGECMKTVTNKSGSAVAVGFCQFRDGTRPANSIWKGVGLHWAGSAMFINQYGKHCLGLSGWKDGAYVRAYNCDPSSPYQPWWWSAEML